MVIRMICRDQQVIDVCIGDLGCDIDRLINVVFYFFELSNVHKKTLDSECFRAFERSP